jgi:predicted hotdog family 3-hydroxylacyl-ACP dehydratase
MNTVPLFHSVAELVPHKAPMLLLESIATWDLTGVDAVVNPRDSVLFADANGEIPAWVGIEYMAQAISALAGIEAKTRGEPVCIGFLLGTRKYSAQVASFKAEQKLLVKVRELLRDETNLVLFNCEIYAEDTLLASAEIKAIQPENIDAVIAQFKQMSAAGEN